MVLDLLLWSSSSRIWNGLYCITKLVLVNNRIPVFDLHFIYNSKCYTGLISSSYFKNLWSKLVFMYCTFTRWDNWSWIFVLNLPSCVLVSLEGDEVFFLTVMWKMAPLKTLLFAFSFAGIIICLLWSTMISPIYMKISGEHI